MEKVYKAPFYCYLRQEAEQNARMNHKNLEDITLDMIYEEIDDAFKSLKQKELDWEAMVLRSNPELMEVYNYALIRIDLCITMNFLLITYLLSHTLMLHQN